MNRDNLPLLSVIVTVYGTEEYLLKCMDSILNCSYPNIELVIVDDKSPGNVSEIVNKYMKNDSRVAFFRHDINRGLYRARLTGVEHAHGDYIAFLDSDDHVSVDFYRKTIEKAEDTDSDIVMGEIYHEFNDGLKYFNFSHTRLLDIDLHGSEVIEFLLNQIGMDYTIHVIWNKVYRKDLWEKCYPYLNEMDKHLIMCEDVLYSSVLFLFAKHLTNIHGDFVYYVKHGTNSTSFSKDVSKIKKNIGDIQLAFKTAISIYKSVSCEDKYICNLKKWALVLKDIWVKNVGDSNFSNSTKDKLQVFINKSFSFANDCSISDIDKKDFFYSAVTSVGKKLKSENLKKKILSSKVKVVSFDVFDTLIVRPFWDPTDLFFILEYFFNEKMKITDWVNFHDLRIEAEKRARQVNDVNHPMCEDITLDDIYVQVKELTGLSDEDCELMKNEEIRLELKYCKVRRYAKELFNLAKFSGKKVIIVSDMYLPRSVVEGILHENGYDGYDELYISSETKYTKATGRVYEYVQKQMDIPSESFLHIGDNPESDVKKAKEAGWKSFWLPRTINRMANQVAGMYGGQAVENVFIKPFQYRDTWTFCRFWGAKALLGMAANHIFDNPFEVINPESDFNGDPRFLGYFAVGIHLFALAQWLIENAQKNKYDNFNFMARDGYLPMEAFELLNKVYKVPAKLHYTHLTRSSILPLQIEKNIDIYSIIQNINIFEKSPKDFIEMLSYFIYPESLEKAEKICKDHGFVYDKHFAKLASFSLFAKLLNEKFINYEKINHYKKLIGKYLAPDFNGKTATFDVGYSCRIESALKQNFGYDITPYYIHINNDLPLKRKVKSNISLRTFYSTPYGVTGVLRELFISKLEPSCKFLQPEGNTIKLVFKDYSLTYPNYYVIKTIQQSAIRFVKDMVDTFRDDIRLLAYEREEVSLPVEYYQAQAKYFDRLMFAAIPFEDDLWMGKRVNVLDYWNNQMDHIRLPNPVEKDYTFEWVHPFWKRAMCLYFIDRNLLKDQVKYKLRNRPMLLNTIICTYKGARWIYRKLKK